MSYTSFAGVDTYIKLCKYGHLDIIIAEQYLLGKQIQVLMKWGLEDGLLGLGLGHPEWQILAHHLCLRKFENAILYITLYDLGRNNKH